MKTSKIWLEKGSHTLSSHSVITVFALCFMNMVATCSQLCTRKCPVNLPHMEKIVKQVITLGNISSSHPRCHQSLCSSQMCNPNTCVPLLNCSGALHINPNHSRCSFTRDSGNVFNYGVNNGPHDQEYNSKPKLQMDEAIPFPLDFYCLLWPQGVLNMNLQIGPGQVQHSNV